MRSVGVGLLGLLAICACVESQTRVPGVPVVQVDGGMPDASSSSKDSGESSPLGPVVTFTAPTPTSDPSSDAVITESTVKVACKVVRSVLSGAAAVDKTMVRIGLRQLDDEGMESWIEQPVNAAADDVYEAQFELRAQPNGLLRFRCVARDLAATPNVTTATLDTLLDLGPKIEVKDPREPSYALKTPVPIKFTVSPDPITEDDPLAAIDSVKVLVSGVEIEVEEDATTPGLYQTSVDFDDRTRFAVPPDSAQISVVAANKRTPVAAVRTVKSDIVIDGKGPTIVVKEPAEGQIVHGKRELKVEVTDPSGVKASSLIANINNGLLVLKDWEGVAPTFTHSFDTSEYTTLTRLSIEVSATDGVGNQTTTTRIIRLDNLPPVISLNPPLIREWRKNGNNIECSALFDPVGDAPNDGDRLTSYGYFRALVEDKTNEPPYDPNEPDPILYIAGVANETVEVHLQRDLSIPLLIDTNNDGICDEINDKEEDGTLLPEAKRPRKIVLSPVTPTGSAWYRLQDEESEDNAACYAPTSASPVVQPSVPNTVCPLSPSFTRVIPARTEGRPPAVYALRPTNTSTGACTGDYWELAQIANPGWNCVAARVEDKVGNVGISEPLRICFGPNDCSGTPMPSCRRDCTISDAQRFHHADDEVGWYFP